MNIIKSNELSDGVVTLGRQSGVLDVYDGLLSPITEDVIELSEEHIAQIEEYAKTSALLYGPASGGKEPTYVQETIGVPSLVVRIDCTVVNGQIIGYEMEDSPSGQGITDRIQKAMGARGVREAILDHYNAQVGDIPRVIVSSRRNHGTDDRLIVGDRYTFDTDRAARVGNNELVIVKTIPGDVASQEEYKHLQPRAIAPLMSEGDKTYLERRGDLIPIRSPEDLLVDENAELVSQVVKARLGSMAMGVSIYLTPDMRRQFTKAGIVSATRLQTNAERYLNERGGASVQPFISPIVLDNPEHRKHAIMRVFVLLGKDVSRTTARVIGGCYVARPELIVHGASNAVSGAVVIPEGEK